MYYPDRMRGRNGADVYKTKTGFKCPFSRYRAGKYKMRSGEMISFLQEADEWSRGAWEIMRKRSYVIFLLLTKDRKEYINIWLQIWEKIG